jgi:hypothetical protein
MLLVFGTFGCLGNDNNSNQVVVPDNATVVVQQQSQDAQFWQMMYWSAVWNNYCYMPYFYHVYTPYYGYRYGGIPTYRPTVIHATINTNVYRYSAGGKTFTSSSRPITQTQSINRVSSYSSKSGLFGSSSKSVSSYTSSKPSYKSVSSYTSSKPTYSSVSSYSSSRSSGFSSGRSSFSGGRR